ncbi:MAG: substrate-binding domain-containing protein [Ruminococcus sp.]|nr:substrate-binding domain-containing protein [Ruminococcus sp.]
MERKKHIGIIMGRIYKKTNKRLLSGILEQARQLGYSTFIYTLNEECYNDKVRSGEKNLFCAISSSQLDGIVYAPYTFASEYFYEYIDSYLKENFNKPVVRIGMESDMGIPVWYDDSSEMSEITLHLIYGHGCRKLICLTGPDTTQVAHNRAEGFVNAMKSAGIPVGDNDIIYGDFWIWAAKKLADEIADGTREMPDAVVCANDTMAIALCDALAERNISVPDNIRVTGYDGFTEARLHVPAITTYQTSQEDLGRNAVCRLYEAMTGETAVPTKLEKGILLCRESCGCNSQNENDRFIVYDEVMADEGILDCTVSAALYETETLNDLVLKMFELQYKFMDRDNFNKERLFLCLCSDWDTVFQTETGRGYRTDGYSDTMYLIGSEGSRMSFPLEQILPVPLDKESITSTFLLPVHFQDQCYGYIALEVNESIDDFNMDYIRYCREVNNALKFLSTQNELKRLLYRQKLSQSRDELTGLYIFENCRGIWTEMQDAARSNGDQMYIIAVTAGGLRHIENDSGYVESDKYLASFADILSKCCNSRERVFKYRDKSFVIIGSGHSPEKRISAYLKQVEESVWRNSISTEEKYMVYARTETKVLPAETYLSPDDAAETVKAMTDKLASDMNDQLSEHIHYSELFELRREIFLHPETDWNGEMCSGRLNISKSYFHKLYAKVFNISFMQDLQKSRLNSAKKLLATTSMLLPDIAEKCGYDYYNFMRVFKKETGFTPTQYRKNKQ